MNEEAVAYAKELWNNGTLSMGAICNSIRKKFGCSLKESKNIFDEAVTEHEHLERQLNSIFDDYIKATQYDIDNRHEALKWAGINAYSILTRTQDTVIIGKAASIMHHCLSAM